MTTLLLAAVVLLVIVGTGGAAVVAVYGTTNSTPLAVFIGGGVLLALKIVLAMLQTEFARRQILADSRKTRHDLKETLNATSLNMASAAQDVRATAEDVKRATNGGLQRAIHEVAAEVKAAHDDPCPEHAGMPRTADGLIALLDRHAGQICEGMRGVAHEAAREVIAELVRANPTVLKLPNP